MKQSPKSLLLTLAPALLAGALTGILFYSGSLYPFGGKSLAWCDMKQQVIPLMMDLKDILAGKGSLFYSTAGAGGMNFWGVFFFFLASPFSLLCAFVDKGDMPFFMNILVWLKLTASALTASVYFGKRHPGLRGAAIPLSVMYAFCGYGLLFYQNVIWLDMMALFPLLLLALWRLTEEKSALPYTLLMAVMVGVNYYIAYMIVLFVALFMGLWLLLAPKAQRRPAAVRFVLGSAGAAALSAVVWLPSLAQYLSSGRGGDIIGGLRRSALFGHLSTSVPLLLCTACILPALASFLTRRAAWTPQVKLQLLLLLMLAIPVFIEPINKMWHTGSYMSFPVRYGFMTVFMGLSLTGTLLEKELRQKRPTAWPTFSILAALTVGLGIFGVFYYRHSQKTLTRYVRTLWGDGGSLQGLLIFFLLALITYEGILLARQWGWLSRRATAVLLTLAVLAESAFHLQVYVTSTQDKLDVAAWQLAAGLSQRIEDNRFFRVKTREKDFDVNLIGAMGYPTFGHYTSLTSEDTLFTMKRLGYSAYWMEVGAHGGTAFSDALLSIGYEISAGASPGAVYQNEGYAITALPDFLPLGLLTNADLSTQRDFPEGQRIPAQQQLFETLFKSGAALFTPYPLTACQDCRYETAGERHYLWRNEGAENSVLTWTVQVKGRQTLYFDCFDRCSNALKEPVNDSLEVSVNGSLLAASYPTQSQNGLLNLGTYEDETVTVTARLLKDLSCKSFGVWGLDRTLLTAQLDKAETAGFTATTGGFTASFDNVSGKRACFLTLPWADSFEVQVNGVSVSPIRCFGDFWAIPLAEGENRIQITFTPKGFWPGLLLTGAGALLLLLFWRWKRGWNWAEGKLGTLSLWGTWLLFAGVIGAVYLGPLILWLMGP